MARRAPPQPPRPTSGAPKARRRGARGPTLARPSGPGPTPPPARSRTASPAPDAQRVTSTAASDQGHRLRARPRSPRAYLPSVSTPPARRRCEALLLSAEAPGLRAPTLCWLRPAPAGPAKAPPRPAAAPPPPGNARFLLAPLPTPHAMARPRHRPKTVERGTAPVRVRLWARTLSRTLVARTPAKASSQSSIAVAVPAVLLALRQWT
uniref:atherin n=1 Tax=Odobenus rosmarus divergens TaxID=9708 RepID=UPI00063CF298|nr:PREDICTED: atherin [Odobenus rosmarus divergens]